ncbi:MAG: FkbM family methyltransferase [Lyngbya sp.]|nr:FkbM family methyltransferase [Lyngbya sp.]
MKFFNENQHTQIIKGRYGYYILNIHSPIGRALQFYGEHGENELNLMREFIPKGTTVFDVGAHQGTHTLAFARFVGESGNVVSFEPQRAMYQIAAGTIALNELYNVRLFNWAIGDKHDIVEIPIFDYKQPGHFSGMSIKPGISGEKVIQETIDNLAYELGLTQNVSLVKIDVEGMEYQVLVGAENLISEARPTIYFELHKSNRYYSQIIQLLKKHKYKVYESITRGFNEDNFFGYKQDRFKGGVDHNALAIPINLNYVPKLVRDLKEIS